MTKAQFYILLILAVVGVASLAEMNLNIRRIAIAAEAQRVNMMIEHNRELGRETSAASGR